jgi:hypothetical protein
VSARHGLMRRVASALMRCAARIMPVARADWSAAMESELQEIEDDGVALRWALGCAAAGCRERASAILQTWYFRSGLGLLIALLALRELFAPLLIFAYRMNYLGLAHFLGLRTAGDDYRRLIPLMDATPAWLPVFWLASGLLYFFALWQMLHRNRVSYIPFVLAFGLDTVGELTAMSLEASTGVAAGPIPLIRAAGFLLTLSTAIVLWCAARAKPGTIS